MQVVMTMQPDQSLCFIAAVLPCRDDDKQHTFIACGERCNAGSVTEVAGRFADDGFVRSFKDRIQWSTKRCLGLEVQALYKIH